MDENKRRNAIDENESIAEGLESFLEKELGGEMKQTAKTAPAAKPAAAKSVAGAKPAASKTTPAAKPAAAKSMAGAKPAASKAAPAAKAAVAGKKAGIELMEEDFYEDEESFNSEFYDDDDDDYVIGRRRIYEAEETYDDHEKKSTGAGKRSPSGQNRRGGSEKKKRNTERSRNDKSSKPERSRNDKGSKSERNRQRVNGSVKQTGSKKRGRKGKAEAEEEKKSRRRKRWLGFLLFLVILLSLFFIMMNVLVGKAYRKMTYEQVDEELAKEPMIEEGVINVLLIGNDSRENGGDGRSDAMILVSVNRKKKTIHMTSFLRDMFVEIPGHGNDRLNAAYAYGGASLLCRTIKSNFDIEVNRYAIVNFQAFAALVDAVGGVDIDVTSEEVEWINAYLNEYNLLEGRDITTDYLDTSLSGVIHLNGPQALAYCRNRYIGTDFGRTERQRKVLSAIMKKAPVAMATNADELLDSIFPYLTTNLSQAEVSRLSFSAGSIATYENRSLTIPADGTWENAKIDGKAVLQVDFEANKKLLQAEIYDNVDTAGETAGDASDGAQSDGNAE